MRIGSDDTLGGRGTLAQVSDCPRLWVADGFLDPEEARAILAAVPPPDSPAARALGGRSNETGHSLELPVDADPALGALRARLTELIGVPNAVDDTFRYRHYAPGTGHPPHLDCYEISGHSLVFTALLHLEEGADGGETIFPETAEGAIAVAPRLGRLVIWANHLPDGRPDEASLHLGGEVRAGGKTTLTWFVYAPLAAAAHTPGSGPYTPADADPQARLFCVNDHAPAETIALIAGACLARGVAFHEVSVGGYDFSEPSPLRPGDMLFRPATSGMAVKLEQHLFVDGVATLYSEADGVYFDTGAAMALFARAGVPAPRTIPCHTTDRARLRRYVEALGGFPVLAKFPGSSSGLGMVLLESYGGLHSFVDYTLNNGARFVLSAFIPDAEHWRVVVVGDEVVAAYRNTPQRDDFRTYDGENPEDYRFPDDPDMLESAVRAVKSLRVDFGGVDILLHPSGRHYVLEANFPCYFATAQQVGGFDVAGRIVALLQAKARVLAGR